MLQNDSGEGLDLSKLPELLV